MYTIRLYDTEIAAFILNKYEQYCQMDIWYKVNYCRSFYIGTK